MSTILNNIMRLFFQHTKSNFLILINIILSTAAIFVLLQNYYYLRQQYNEIYGTTNVAHNYSVVPEFNLRQNYNNDVLNKSPMYYIGKEVFNELEADYDIIFFDCSCGAMDSEYLDNSVNWENFVQTVEEFSYKYIDVHYLPANGFRAFNIEIGEGNNFTEEDYSDEDLSKPLSAILGYNYSKVFNIGDTFTYDGDTAVIIGFLKENSSYNEYGIYYNLDDAVLLPQIFPRLQGESNLLPEELYLVHAGNEDVDVQAAINAVTTKYGYYTIEVSPIDGIQLTSTKDISEKNVKLIGILALIACTICALSLASILVNRTLQDVDVYCIYLCCGIPMWKINLSIAIEMMIYLVISIFPTVAISIREYGSLIVPLWQILLFAGSITVISLIPTFITNRKCNIDLMIRDRIV